MNIRACVLLTLIATFPGVHAFEPEDDLLADPLADLSSEMPLVDDGLPVVLTATRLRQPRAEVPASVTVIEAEQIAAWGVRTVPELMRFVPGMFVGHGDDENNAAVAYHSGSPNVMRRLQVLVDGRSVFRAGIASVNWNDIPVALDDIRRIEVTRGPSSATYGSNSFQGVINIISKHPGDTLGGRVRYRNGSEGIDDGFASYSWLSGATAWRLSSQVQASDNFDGRHSPYRRHDHYRDSTRHGFVSLNSATALESGWNLESRFAYQRGHTDIRQNEFYIEPPDIQSRLVVSQVNLTREFSAEHSTSIRAYWQSDRRHQEVGVRVPVVMLDPALYELYRLDNGVATGFVDGLQSAGSLADIQATIASLDASDEANQLMMQILANTGGDPANLLQTTPGVANYDITDERFDIEFQDTRRWTPIARSVVGASMRRDQVESETYFGGKVNNDTYRAFGNLELRPWDQWLFNIGATYETEDSNNDSFSPRVGVNYLLTPQQGIRLIHSEATRSPDLLEQNPDYTVRARNLGDNYLGLDAANFWLHQWPESRQLKQEKIISTELGYYGRFNNPDLEVDLKIFQEHMTQLISDPITIQALEIDSDTQLDIDGAELQLRWNATPNDWLWLTLAKLDIDASNPGGGRHYLVDTRLSASESMVASWSHQRNNWAVTGSYFWYNRYNEQTARERGNAYRRYEVNLRLFGRWGKYRPSMGVFVHHIVDRNQLMYTNQRFAAEQIYFVQLGLNF